MRSVLLFLALAFVGSASEARELRFVLKCKWSLSAQGPVGAPKYQFVKIAKKVNGKWTSKYQLEVKPQNPSAPVAVFGVRPAYSGDEDYDEYFIVDPDNKTAVTGVYIQDRFKWAALMIDGVSSYDCRK